MAMPKSTQTRFLGIRDNHNQYTSLRLLFYTDLLMSTYPRHAIATWSVLDLHVGEIYPVSHLIMHGPHATQKSKRRDV